MAKEGRRDIYIYIYTLLNSGWKQGCIIPFMSRYKLSNSISVLPVVLIPLAGAAGEWVFVAQYWCFFCYHRSRLNTDVLQFEIWPQLNMLKPWQFGNGCRTFVHIGIVRWLLQLTVSAWFFNCKGWFEITQCSVVF